MLDQSQSEVKQKPSPEYFDTSFSNSLIIHAEKTKEITTVKEVWICDLNYHKIWWTFALIFSKNYQWFDILLEIALYMITNRTRNA